MLDYQSVKVVFLLSHLSCLGRKPVKGASRNSFVEVSLSIFFWWGVENCLLGLGKEWQLLGGSSQLVSG